MATNFPIFIFLVIFLFPIYVMRNSYKYIFWYLILTPSIIGWLFYFLFSILILIDNE